MGRSLTVASLPWLLWIAAGPLSLGEAHSSSETHSSGPTRGQPRKSRSEAQPARDAPGQWTYLGLGSREVGRLRLHGEVLYACTDAGLFRKELASVDTLWAPLGLAGRRIHALWAASPESILAALRLASGDSVSLYRTTDGGASWLPYQNGFGAGWDPEVKDLEGIPPGRDMIGVARTIEKSTSAGAEWRQVAQGSVFNFVRANPSAPGHVWAGGETGFLSPVIFRSIDSGDTWREIHLEAGGDNACDAVAFHPTDPNVVYVGMEGRVMRTLDGGDNWKEATSPNPTLYLYGMAIRGRLPLRVYAAGANALLPDPRGVVLYASDDGGRSWNALAQTAPLRYGVFDLHYVGRVDEDWLLLATDRGVYRYVDAPTALAPRSWSQVKELFRPPAPRVRTDGTH